MNQTTFGLIVVSFVMFALAYGDHPVFGDFLSLSAAIIIFPVAIIAYLIVLFFKNLLG